MKYVVFLMFLLPGSAGATFTVQGTNLTVTSHNLQVSLSGADVVGITNRLTGESYLRSPSPTMQLNLTLMQPPTQALAAVGAWTVNGSTASLNFTDPTRSVSVTVTVDPSTQEVVIGLTGTAQSGGVEQLIWGITGFDMTAGRFVVPGWGGMEITSSSFASQGPFYFYYDAWDAPFSLFQSNLGGVTVYSTDTHSLCKDLTILANQEQTANELFQAEAPGPWSAATQAGPIEWRLAAYQGDWQAGARIYRDWHTTVAPPVPLTGGRAWVNDIETVIQEDGGHPYQTSDLDSLASVLIPSKTLLYMFDWRSQPYDVGYPDYSWDPSTPAFIAYAHNLGFRVMLHTDVLGVAPSSADYSSVQQYQIKDPLTLQLQGWNWNQPVSSPARYALIDPASAAYRSLFVARVGPAIETLQPDAIHLDFTTIFNDGNGLIDGKNFNQGLAQLEADLLAAFPNLVLGTEESNDAIAAPASFCQPLYWIGLNLSSSVTPPVAVAAYALPNVHRYRHLGVINPYESGFIQDVEQYEAQAVLPTFHTTVPNYSQTDMARYLGVVDAFQSYNLQPAWDAAWNDTILEWQGSGGVTASLTDTGTSIQFASQQSSSSTVLYQRAHAVNELNSARSVDNWPAYSGMLTLGLDPANQYWVDPANENAALVHIDGLPSGARLGLGDGTLVMSQFAYFQLLPPAADTFNFFSNLWLADAGVTYQGKDFPLANGAVVGASQMTVGGVTKQAILTFPPYYAAQFGGDVFMEYSVPVPAHGAELSFEAGIIDQAIGQRQGPMTFEVAVGGAVLWSQNISTGAWQEGSLSLAAYRGQTVKIRFITDPGPSGNPDFGWAGWSELQLAIATDDTLSGISLAVPSTLPASNVVLSGGSASVSNGTASVNGLPAGGTILVFTGAPVAVSAGQSLLNIPFTLSQGSSQQLAGPATGAYAGTGAIGHTTSGGVTKPTTLYAFAPLNGQTIFSWLLQLPSSPGLSLSFSTAYWDGYAPFPQGFLMSVRVNGTKLWQYNVNSGGGWNYGAVGLSKWSGQTVLIELITDSQGPNTADFTSWAELAFNAAGNGSNCSVSLGSYGPLSAPNTGSSGTISVSTAPGCDWIAEGQSGWITAAASSSAGNGTVTYTIAPNLGAARQSSLVIAGNEIIVSQMGFSRCDINQEGITDVVDVQSIVNEALGLKAAVDDLNQDGLVNVPDVQIVINSALGKGCPAA